MEPATRPEPVLLEVSVGVFAYTQPDGCWWINNTGFFASSRGVINIDACATESRGFKNSRRRQHAVGPLKNRDVSSTSPFSRLG